MTQVAPIIKLSRWSLLTVGIIYGYRRHNSLNKKVLENKGVQK